MLRSLRLASCTASRLAPALCATRRPFARLATATATRLATATTLTTPITPTTTTNLARQPPALGLRLFSSKSAAAAETVTPREANDTGRFVFEIGKERVVLPLTPEVSDTLRTALSAHSSKILDTVRSLEAEKQAVEGKLAPLLVKDEELKTKAGKKADLVMNSIWVYLMGQGALVGYFTWWEFSWDIMEPITYFIGFGTALIGYTYYVASKREYTFVDLHDSIQQRALRKYRRKNGYSLAEIEGYQNKLSKIDERLRLIHGDL